MRRPGHRRTLRLGLAGAGAALAVAALVVHGIRETTAVTLRRVDVPCTRLPPAFDGYRIALLSCLHLRGAGTGETRAAELLRAERFDLAVIAGDLRRSNGSLEEMAQGLDVLLPVLRAPDGLIACKGNHDTPLAVRLARERGIVMLLGHSRAIHRGEDEIWVGGVVDSSAASLEVEKVFREVPATAFRILVAHNPDATLPASKAGVDLVLSGDTHGGQVRLPLIGVPVTKTTIGRRFVYGLNALGGTLVYTNPGLGTTGLRFRLGVPPEITLLTLRRTPAPPPQS